MSTRRYFVANESNMLLRVINMDKQRWVQMAKDASGFVNYETALQWAKDSTLPGNRARVISAEPAQRELSL